MQRSLAGFPNWELADYRDNPNSLERGDHSLRLVDLNAMVGELAQVVGQMQRGVLLDLSLEPGLGPTRCDPDQLELAILTLPSFHTTIHPDDQEAFLAFTQRLLASDQIANVKANHISLKSGSDIWVNLSLSHLWQPSRTAECLLAIEQ